MPCSKYQGKQRGLCYLTHGWKDFSKVRSPEFRKMFKVERKEHPTLSNRAITQIVKDHMRKH